MRSYHEPGTPTPPTPFSFEHGLMPAALHMEVLDGGEAELAISDADPHKNKPGRRKHQACARGASERRGVKSYRFELFSLFL